MGRQMAMVGFLQAQNCTHLPASWRPPESRPDFLSADFYREIARVLEAGNFHLAFFDDRLAMPDRYGNDQVHTVEHGIRCVKLDPLVVLMTMGRATKDPAWAPRARTPHYSPSPVRGCSPRSPRIAAARPAGNWWPSPTHGRPPNQGAVA